MIRQLILGAVVPGITAAILLALAWWKRQDQAPSRTRSALVALVFGVAVAAGLWTINRAFSLPPKSSRDYLPLAGAGALVAALVSICGTRAWWRWVGWTAGPLAVAILATRSGAVPKWSLMHQGLAIGALTVAGVVLCWSTWRLVQPATRLGLLAVYLVLVGAAQVMVLPLGALNLGQVVGVLAAVFGAALVISFALPGRSLGAAGATFTGSFLVAPMTHGIFLGALDVGEASLLTASIPISSLLATLLLLPRVQRQHMAVRLILVAVTALGPSAVAIGVHMATAARPE